MEKDKLYKKCLSCLNKSGSLNELEIAQHIYGERIISSEQLYEVGDLIDELLTEKFITESTLLLHSDVTTDGHVIDEVRRRYSISISGLTYLRSSSNNRIFIWMTTNKQIIAIITSIVALSLTAIGLYLKYG